MASPEQLQVKQQSLTPQASTPVENYSVSPAVTKPARLKIPWTIPLSFAYHTWQDRFFLNANGQKQTLLSPISGVSLLIGLEKRFLSWEWGGELGYFLGKGNFGSTDGTTFQENITLSGIMGGIKIMRPLDDQVSFGLKLPFFVGQGNYGALTNPGYSYEGDKKSLFGIQFLSNYRLKKWNLGMGIGRWTYDKYLYWTTQIAYDF